VTTTVGEPAADQALDRVYPAVDGFLYLTIVLDVWSRRIVDWAIEPHLKTALVLSALNMALAQRCPQGVSHHSDRGCQYTSYAFGKRCQEAGVMPSMGSTGDAYDNAMAESFFVTLEREALDRRRFQSQAEARLATFQSVRGWRLVRADAIFSCPTVFRERSSIWKAPVHLGSWNGMGRTGDRLHAT